MTRDGFHAFSHLLLAAKKDVRSYQAKATQGATHPAIGLLVTSANPTDIATPKALVGALASVERDGHSCRRRSKR
jgi:hypothetical protein